MCTRNLSIYCACSLHSAIYCSYMRDVAIYWVSTILINILKTIVLNVSRYIFVCSGALFAQPCKNCGWRSTVNFKKLTDPRSISAKSVPAPMVARINGGILLNLGG